MARMTAWADETSGMIWDVIKGPVRVISVICFPVTFIWKRIRR